jgi:hypothetical protein
MPTASKVVFVLAADAFPLISHRDRGWILGCPDVSSIVESRQIPDAEGIKTVPFDEVESGADGVASTEEKRGIAILFEEDDILDDSSMDRETLLVREAAHAAGKASLEDHFSRDSKP